MFSITFPGEIPKCNCGKPKFLVKSSQFFGYEWICNCDGCTVESSRAETMALQKSQLLAERRAEHDELARDFAAKMERRCAELKQMEEEKFNGVYYASTDIFPEINGK